MIREQEQLYSQINSLNNLPYSILLMGDQVSGKQEICEYIALRFNLTIFDLSKSTITNEYISIINQSTERTLYIIDSSNLTIKDQNVLLKFYEEPNEYTYIIIKSISEVGLLDTILSRSYILKMKALSKEYLKTLSDNDYILSICTTPGQIEVANRTNMDVLKSLCHNLIDNRDIYGLLLLANKINFSDEYDKIDLLLFIKAFEYECLIQNKLDIYLEINKLNRYIWNMNSKKQYFEHFLINLWKLKN